jgi:hypothetical protein
MKSTPSITEEPISLSPRTRFQAAMILAMAADALQIFVFPLFGWNAATQLERKSPVPTNAPKLAAGLFPCIFPIASKVGVFALPIA